MRYNNRSVLSALSCGLPLSAGMERGVGKTTGAILAALGKSYEHPGEWVEVADPDISTQYIARGLVDEVRRKCRQLGLEHIEVRQGAMLGEPQPRPPYTHGRLGVFIRNTFADKL